MSVGSRESAMLHGKVSHLRIFEHQKLVLIGFPKKKNPKKIQNWMDREEGGSGKIWRRGLNIIKTHMKFSKN